MRARTGYRPYSQKTSKGSGLKRQVGKLREGILLSLDEAGRGLEGRLGSSAET